MPHGALVSLIFFSFYFIIIILFAPTSRKQLKVSWGLKTWQSVSWKSIMLTAAPSSTSFRCLQTQPSCFYASPTCKRTCIHLCKKKKNPVRWNSSGDIFSFFRNTSIRWMRKKRKIQKGKNLEGDWMKLSVTFRQLDLLLLLH